MKNTDDLIEFVAKSRRFTKEDVKIVLDGIVEFFETCSTNKEELKIRGFGKLHYVPIPQRKIKSFTDKNGEFHPETILPPTIKVNFKIAENIRNRAKPALDNLDKI